MQTKFKNGQVAKIFNTGSGLDNVEVIVTGVSMFDAATSQAFYVIEKVSGELFQTQTGEWKSITLTQHCLSPIQ